MNNPSRKKRVAKGSGTKLFDIEQLIKDFNNMKKMMGKISKKNLNSLMGENQNPDLSNLFKN